MEPCKCGPQIANLKQDLQKLLLTLNDAICNKLKPMEKRLSKLESEANNVKAIPTEIKTVIEIEKDVEKLKIQNNEVQMKLKSHEKKLEIQKDAEATNEAFFQKTEVSLKFIEDNQSTLNKTIEDKIDSVQAEVTNLNTKLDQFYDVRTKKLENTFSTFQDEYLENCQYYEGEVSSIKRMFSQIEKNPFEMENRIKDIKFDVSMVKAHVDLLQEDMEKLKNENNITLSQINKAKVKVKTKLEEVDHETKPVEGRGVENFRCKMCGKKVRGEYGLSRHINDIHSNSKIKL